MTGIGQVEVTQSVLGLVCTTINLHAHKVFEFLFSYDYWYNIIGLTHRNHKCEPDWTNKSSKFIESTTYSIFIILDSIVLFQDYVLQIQITTCFQEISFPFSLYLISIGCSFHKDCRCSSVRKRLLAL